MKAKMLKPIAVFIDFVFLIFLNFCISLNVYIKKSMEKAKLKVKNLSNSATKQNPSSLMYLGNV